MLTTLCYLEIEKLLILFPSPLDQFGEDEDFLAGSPLEYFENFNRFLPSIVFIVLDEIIDIIDVFGLENDYGLDFLWQVLPSLASAFIDDEENDDSQWDESDIIIGNVQSTIFISNLFGLIPGSDTSTSEIFNTFFNSFSILLTLIVIGASIHGIRYFAIFLPSGTPISIAPFIIIIEIISFLARAVILGMRLFANMFAGHSLVKIINSFFWSTLGANYPFLSLPMAAMLLIILCMELAVAYLQSYVFSVLAAMYVEETISFSGH